jgi:hypothetical protein
MKVKAAGIGLLAVFLFFTPFLPGAYAEETARSISQEQLLSILDTPSLTILDARLAKDWRNSDSKIKGAVRVDPHDVSSWIGNYSPDQKIVIYCS